jgi:hypothetical protein
VHSTSTALVFEYFEYAVATGQNTADVAVAAVNLNGTAIKDGANNIVDLTGAVTNPAGTLQIDTIGPQVQGFTATDPLLTNANVVHYTEPVTGVVANDFSLVTTGVSGASIASVIPVGGSNGAQYTITVNTGTGDGTIALDLSGAGIQDLAGNPLPGGRFQRHTTGLALPDRRMISVVPQPSAVARMILARQTCALPSPRIASSRRRSRGVTFTTIPALMARA